MKSELEHINITLRIQLAALLTIRYERMATGEGKEVGEETIAALEKAIIRLNEWIEQ